MIIGNLYGGLGNQLFQYSAALSFSKQYGHELKFVNIFNKRYRQAHTKFDLDKLYNLKISYIDSYELKQKFGYLKSNYYFNKFAYKFNINFDCIITDKLAKTLANNKNYFLYGYFQNYKYLKYTELTLHKYFYEPRDINNLNKYQLYQEILNTHSVSLHIRGGDYLANPMRQVCNYEYYFNAIKKIKYFNSNAIFYIFSDDLNYAKNILSKLDINYRLVDNHFNNALNLYLMSKCKDNIIANSSFSWWAAYLNNNKYKKIISPKKWLTNYNKSLALKEWIIL